MGHEVAKPFRTESAVGVGEELASICTFLRAHSLSQMLAP